MTCNALQPQLLSADVVDGEMPTEREFATGQPGEGKSVLEPFILRAGYALASAVTFAVRRRSLSCTPRELAVPG